jgi:hypothetical protein
VTSLGTPIAYYTDAGIGPEEGGDWDDVDYYDSDGDGMLNWMEYIAGTDPTDPLSVFLIVTVVAEPGEVLPFPARLFSAPSNRTHHELLLIEVGESATPIPGGRRVGM